MPTTLFHLKVGYEIAQQNQKYNVPNYYLGLLAPDAVNLNGFAEKEKRWAAHNRDEDLEKWKTNVFELYNTLDKLVQHEYAVGYLIHILTDIIVDKLYLKEIYADLLNKVKNLDEVWNYFNKQMDMYERSQLNEIWWKKVKEKLIISKATDVNNISAFDIEMWRNKILNEYELKEITDYDYITPEFVKKCTKDIMLNLINNIDRKE